MASQVRMVRGGRRRRQRRVRRVVDGAKKEGSNDHKQGEKKGWKKADEKKSWGGCHRMALSQVLLRLLPV